MENIKDFETFVNEGIFTNGIHRKNQGLEKKEDDINFLDMDDFCDYIKTHYDIQSECMYKQYDLNRDRFEFDLYKRIGRMAPGRLSIIFSSGKISHIQVQITKGDVTPLLDSDKYMCSEPMYGTINDTNITMKKRNDEMTNKICLDIIDELIDGLNKDGKEVLIKKK